MVVSMFTKRLASLPAQSLPWSPPSTLSLEFYDLQIYGIVLMLGELTMTFLWLGIVLNMYPHIRFKNVSMSCRVSLCLVSVCFELLKSSNSMYGTMYYYHSIFCSLINITATVFALLFNLGPLSVLRSNNRKNLMPTIPDLSKSAFDYIMSVTTFEESYLLNTDYYSDRAIIHINFIRYNLRIGRKAYNSLILKQYKESLQLYLSTIAQHKENDDLVSRMLVAIDEYGFIRRFIPRLPSTNFILAYQQKTENFIILFELVSIEATGDQTVRYYYAELKNVGFPLNDMQKKSISWLLSEMNECVVMQLRTFCVKNYLVAGLSESSRMPILRRSRIRYRR